MTHIDRSWLELVGFPPTLEDADADRLIGDLTERLEQRVGVAIAAELTEEAFERCSAAIDAGDDASLAALLREACPSFPVIVRREFGRLTDEVREVLGAAEVG